MADETALQAFLTALGSGGGGHAPTANQVTARLTAHLGPDAGRMQIVTEVIEAEQHVNLQAALDAYLAETGRTHELLGIRGGESSGILGMTQPPQLVDLLGVGNSPTSARFGPVEHVSRPAGPDKKHPCVNKGLLLLNDSEGPLAAWIRDGGIGNMPTQPVLDVVSPDIERSERFLAELGRLMAGLNVYRGHVLSVGADTQGKLQLAFASRFSADREAVILPTGVLETLEEQTIGIGEMREQLRAAGRHLKRGLLLYGPPGTGKTHTIRYLTSRLPDYTVFLLTGSAMSALGAIGRMLPTMAPAVVVLDDVDLIAEDRERGRMSPRRFLFDLLDLMDGLHDDLDVVFILTTNRVGTIESAISSRPGRVDSAVEIPLPDPVALDRLIDLYGQGLDLRLSDRKAVLDRIAGVTASFVREMLRRASLSAVREGVGATGPLVVTDVHVHAALDRLLDPAGPLTAALLGRQAPPATAGPDATEGIGDAWCPLS